MMIPSKYSIGAFMMSVTLSWLGVASAQPIKVQKALSQMSQGSPTKEQTVEFLSQKIGMRHSEPSGFSYGPDGWETKSSFSNDNCTLRLETSKSRGEKLDWRTVAEVGLSKIDPTQVGSFAVTRSQRAKFFYGYENPAHIVQVATTGNEETVNFTDYKFENGVQVSEKPTRVAHAWVFAANADTAQRVEKALRHLIIACGGKKELF
jgi:hypothetical protein